MIKTTVKEIVDSTKVFNNLMTQDFDGGVAFRIARIAREVEKELETFNKQRKNIIEKYCARDEDNNPITNENGDYIINKDNYEQCNSDFNSLLKNEIEINAEKLSLEDVSKFTITPQNLITIQSFINE